MDRVRAEAFAADLDANLTKLAGNIKTGNYNPVSLRATFLPKPNSNKERMICIPTVTDRLVQRTITHYLVETKKLPIYNSSSFGFIKKRGTVAAINEAKRLRSKYDWCLKTDIETFFDSIPRTKLKERIIKSLGRSSLVPLILKFVDCDIKLDERTRRKLREQNIQTGVGLRQGMPLSPILANLILSDFDKEIERAKIPMVRYADDLLLFFDSEEDAEAGHRRIKDILRKVDLTIPEISDRTKTKIFGPKATVDFLGQELVHLGSNNSYVACIGGKQISKINNKLRTEYNYSKQAREGGTLQEALVDLSRSISAYRAVYSNVYDFERLDQSLRAIARAIVSKMFKDIFGHDALAKLDNYGRNFLGIGDLRFAESANELDPN